METRDLGAEKKWLHGCVFLKKACPKYTGNTSRIAALSASTLQTVWYSNKMFSKT